MRAPWPDDFARIPVDEEWVRAPIEDLAAKYDSVEQHGWYANLDPTVEEAADDLEEGQVVVDYSGGTGIFAERLLGRVGELAFGVVEVDASPKFLRLALEKLGSDPRVAFRLLRWRRAESRLDALDEVLGALAGRADAVVSTNAVHLYRDLEPTFAGWARAARPGARAYVQSGNVRLPDAPSDRWILDDTVEAVDRAAREIASEDDAYAAWRPALADAERLAAYDAFRRRVFPAPRPLGTYRDALEATGWSVADVVVRPIVARVSEWREFLSVYHEAVLGWAGGAEKVDGRPASDADVRLRLDLLGRALDRALGGRAEFRVDWTYVTAVRGERAPPSA